MLLHLPAQLCVSTVVLLIAGNGAQMVRVFPYGALQFTCFEVFKKYLPQVMTMIRILMLTLSLLVHWSWSQLSWYQVCSWVTGWPHLCHCNLPSGHHQSQAGFPGIYLSSVHFIRTCLQSILNIFFLAVNNTCLQSICRKNGAFFIFLVLLLLQVTETRYTGIVHTGVSIFRTEGGVIGLYRGLIPTLIGIIPYAGLSFYCFEVTKSVVLQHWGWARTPEQDGKMTLSVPAKLLCGGLAGAFAQTASYPLDVARRRMQVFIIEIEN